MPTHPTFSGQPGAIATLNRRAGVLTLALAWWCWAPEARDLPSLRQTSQLILDPGTWVIAGTGLSLALPDDVTARLTVLPELGLRTGLLTPERTLDPGFQGELVARLIATHTETITLAIGTPILELRVSTVTGMRLDPVTAFPGQATPPV